MSGARCILWLHVCGVVGNAYMVQTTPDTIGNDTWLSKRSSDVIRKEFQFTVLTDKPIKVGT